MHLNCRFVLYACIYVVEQIFVFLEHGISLETIETEIGQSLLRLALSENDVKNQETTGKELQNLLSHGANLHFTPQNVDSELILAIRRGYFRIADLLLELGADIMHVGRNGNTLIHIICERKSILYSLSLSLAVSLHVI